MQNRRFSNVTHEKELSRGEMRRQGLIDNKLSMNSNHLISPHEMTINISHIDYV